MAAIRKRKGTGKKVRWQAQVRRDGHHPQTKTFDTKAEAEAWAASIETAINRDEFVPSPEAKRRTVREMLERYLKTEVPKKRQKRNDIRHAKFWIEKLGSYRISAVTRAQIIEIRDQMATQRAPATVNRYLATLRHAFSIAELDWEWANKSPTKRIMLSEPRGRDRHLDNDEVRSLLAASKSSDHPHLYAMVLIALTTGARYGEIEGLTWVDIDLKKGRAVLQETKNTDKRLIVLVPQVTNALREVRKIRRIDSDAVFGRINPDGRRTFPSFRNAWLAALNQAEIDNFRFHDLRHTFASRMAMRGHSLPEIAGALGHRTLAMVQRYAHLTEGHVHSAMESTALSVLGE